MTTGSDITLYDYWRSSAGYRVRIGLALKEVAFERVAVNIAPGALEQRDAAYAAINPQMRVPTLVLGDGTILSQSMAILDFLEETHSRAAFLPHDPVLRARVRAFADLIACDIHPLNNSSVLAYLRASFSADLQAITAWYHEWVARGFAALERLAADFSPAPFLTGAEPGLAEICLVPQMANARRFEMDLTAYPALLDIDAAARAQAPFAAAAPECQSDAP